MVWQGIQPHQPFSIIIYSEDELKRDFYLQMCRIEKWSVRTLQDKIAGMLYERTAISRKPRELIRQELDALRKKDALSQDLECRYPQNRKHPRQKYRVCKM